MSTCPKCGNQVQEDAIFCDQCGTRLKPAEVPAAPAAPSAPAEPAAPQEPVAAASEAAPGAICPSCGATNTPGEMFCDNCGAPLAAPQPEPEAVAAAQAPTPAVATAPNTCPDCGATVAEGDEFCYACGADLSAVRAAAPAPAPAAETPAVEPAPDVQPAEAAPPPTEPVPPPAAPEAAPEASTPAEAPARVCPACGAQVGADDAFCESCGAALVAAAEVAPAARPAAPAPVAPTAEAGPRLIVAASGVEIPLPAGKEALVGREDPYSGIYPEVDLTPHGGEDAGVSRRHFKMTPSRGGYTVEDLNSTNYTLVNRQRLQPGVPTAISDGDEIRAGSLKLIFRAS